MNRQFTNDLEYASGHLPKESFRGKKVLITGATGLIGSAIAKMLILNKAFKCKLYLMSRSEENLKNCYREYIGDSRINFLIHDICNPIHSDEAFDYIIDSAGYGHPSAFKENPVDVIQSNLIGIDNLLTHSLPHSSTRIVYVSTGEVYGEGDGNDFKEDYSGYVNPVNVRSCYPSAKRASESLCVAFASQYGVHVSIARPCHVYGPNFAKHDNRAYAQFLERASHNEDIVLKSYGTPVRSWIYVVDCAYAILYLLLNGQKGEAYNISPINDSASIREFAETVAKAGGCNVVFDFPKGEENITSPVTRAVLDSSKLMKVGWKNLFTLEEGIKNSVKSLRSE